MFNLRELRTGNVLVEEGKGRRNNYEVKLAPRTEPEVGRFTDWIRNEFPAPEMPLIILAQQSQFNCEVDSVFDTAITLWVERTLKLHIERQNQRAKHMLSSAVNPSIPACL